MTMFFAFGIVDSGHARNKSLMNEKFREEPLFCHNCGNQVADGSKFCDKCGTALQPNSVPTPAPKPNPFAEPNVSESYGGGEEVSPKSKLVAVVLTILFGELGVHNFYTGHILAGVLKLSWLMLCVLALSTGSVIGLFGLIPLSLWVLIDLIMILCNFSSDENGLPIIKM